MRVSVALCTIAFLALAMPSGAAGQAASPSCGDAARGRLGDFEGTWRVTAVFRAGDASWDSTSATATITPELSGCLLREDYRGERFGESYSYVALWGANGLDGAPYQRTFAHSQHGLLILREGDFAGDTLVLRSKVMVRGQEIVEEDRVSRPTSSSFSLINRRSTDGGATWTTTRRSTYVRSGR